jgi:hypothetical protein
MRRAMARDLHAAGMSGERSCALAVRLLDLGCFREYLGITPAMARSSYVDPRVLDRYEQGEVISPRATSQTALGKAVLELLDQ